MKILKSKLSAISSRLTDAQFGALLSIPGLIMLVLWVIVPLGILIWVSFMSYDFISPTHFVGLKNYFHLFGDRVFRLASLNTLIFFAGSTSLTFLIAFPAAWFLSRIRRGGVVFRTLIMFPWAVPLIISGFLWKWIFNASYGVLNHILTSLNLVGGNINFVGSAQLAMITVIVADAWTRVPFMTILSLAGIEGIREDLYEVSEIDGADVFQKLRYITLPLAKGPILIGLLITSIFSFRTIDAIFSLTAGGPAKATYVLGLLELDNIYGYLQFGRAGALGVLMFIGCAVIASGYMYFLRR